MPWFELAAGLVLLFAGGEALVRGSVALATRMGVSPLVIGLTLVGFGTSAPELVASLDAALSGAPAIAVGNVVGSNVANILLILGLAAAVSPVATEPRAFRRDGTVLMAATLLFAATALTGEIGRATGLGFLAVLAIYVAYAYFAERARPGPAGAMLAAEAEAVTVPARGPAWIAAALAVGGIAAVVLGADLLVGAAIEVARTAGLSEAVVGLTIVAVGTSLPELATSLVAAIRRQGDVAFGNVVGSNIFNLLGIAGATAVATPVPVPGEIVSVDVWAMLAATVLLVVFAVTGRRVSRGEGAALLLLYGGYIALQAARSAG